MIRQFLRRPVALATGFLVAIATLAGVVLARERPTTTQARAALAVLARYVGEAPANFPLAPEGMRNYRVSFAEEFDAPIDLRDEKAGPGAKGRWNQRYWYGAPGFFSAHDDYSLNTMVSRSWSGDDVHAQANGVMSLRADRKPAGARAEKYGERPFIGSILTTDESVEQRYGYFEARLRAPRAAGYWPAFWLWCKEDSGEIDIAEFQTTEPDHVYASTHQRMEKAPGNGFRKLAAQIDKTDEVAPPVFGIADWHTYGLAWTKDALVWLIDGKQVKRVSPHTFHSPCFVILTNGVGGWNDANRVTREFPGRFEIDYVRIGSAD